MCRYTIRRLLWVIALVFTISLLVFVIFNVLPSGDIAATKAGRQATPAAIEAIRRQLKLDDPKHEQFGRYIGDLVTDFDFGHSYTNDADVKELIFTAMPNTLFLVAGAAVLWLLSGLAIGMLSAVRRGSLADRIAMGGALVAISAPVYWLGLVLLYLFSDDIGQLHIFPGAGSYQEADGFFAKIPTLILPWLVLAAAFTAIYARLMRGNMVEVLSEDYIRTARAKGLRERRVITRHAARSALTPVVTVFGIDVGVLMGGAILTETVFNINGIGRLSYEAINRHDLPTIQGATLFLALGVALMSLLVDIVYAFLDPRVRYD